MQIKSEQQFELQHPANQQEGLAFVQDPLLALAEVRFIRNLKACKQGIQGELVVQIPVMGEIDLPFQSRLEHTSTGARLIPISLEERAWVEVAGQAVVSETGQLDFHFQFCAHLQIPAAEGWGGTAFEKMVRAAAERTLQRVAKALPEGLSKALKSATSRPSKQVCQ